MCIFVRMKVSNIMTIPQLAYVIYGDSDKQFYVNRRFCQPTFKRGQVLEPKLTVVYPFPHKKSDDSSGTGPTFVVVDDKMKSVLGELGLLDKFIAAGEFEFLEVEKVGA